MTWVEGADVAAFAALLKKQLTGKTPAASAAAPAAGGTSEYSTVKLPSEEGKTLSLGYYLVDTTLGTLCSLDTTNPNVTMEEKNEEPTVDKEVEEGNSWGAESTAKIGDTVNFKITIHAKKGARNYVIHDQMTKGLTLNKESIKVYSGEISDATKIEESNYTLKTESLSDECDFEISFNQDYLDTLDNTDLIVSYKAILNEEAEIADQTNNNKTKLDYGNNSHTEWDSTTTKTFKFDIVKTDSDKKLLDGAEFDLYDAQQGGKKITLVDKGNGVYSVAEEEGTTSVKIVAQKGRATVQGLDANTSYWLEETKAPDGFNKLSGRQEVKIGATNLITTMSGDTWIEGNGGVQITNQSGSELPSTGGIGTTIFYVVGSILLVGAAVLLITRKRMNSAK